MSDAVAATTASNTAVNASDGESIGATSTSIARITRDDLRAFHAAWFGAAGAVVSVAGAADPDVVRVFSGSASGPVEGVALSRSDGVAASRFGVGIVSAGEWQAARSTGAWTQVGCDVAPGFEFEDFHFVSAVADHEQSEPRT